MPAELRQLDAVVALIDLKLLGVGVTEALAASFLLERRQTARNIFNLYVLSSQVNSLPAFIQAINEHGANVPIDALMRGLRTLPWLDLMDEYDSMESMPEYADLTLFEIKRYFDVNPIL